MSTEVIAHRGFSGRYSENTLTAFERAIDIGADAFELDIHLSKDGHLVVIHDETVNRTTNGKGQVRTMTLAELKQLHIRGHPAEKIPTLTEVFYLVQMSRSPIRIHVECKTDVYDYLGIEPALISSIEQLGFQQRVVISSFNHLTLRRIKKHRPSYAIGVLYHRHNLPINPWEQARHLGAAAIHPHHQTLSQKMIEQCHTHGVGICPYTINSKRRMRQLLNWGVDGIFTDHPDRLIQINHLH